MMKYLRALLKLTRVCNETSHNSCHVLPPGVRCIHRTPAYQLWGGYRDENEQENKRKEIMIRTDDLFDEAARKARNKQTYQRAVLTYLKHQNVYRRGHVEFIYAAMKRMKEFGVHRDLSLYKKLVTLFPQHKMVPQNAWQVDMMHYPKQQQCCIDILEQMEQNGVVPDDEMGYMLQDVFGKHSHAFRKYRRIMYWMPKFKHLNPYPVPRELPEDPTELARLAVQRMSVDLQNVVSVHQTKSLVGSYDDTFVVSGQSPQQRELLSEHPVDTALFVEGGFTVWLRQKSLVYFVLKSEVTMRQSEFKQRLEEEDDCSFDWKLPFFDDDKEVAEVMAMPSIHEQDDGTVLSLCITGTGSKDSLISWIKLLQETNPTLSSIPVVFKLQTPESGLTVIEDCSPQSLPAFV